MSSVRCGRRALLLCQQAGSSFVGGAGWAVAAPPQAAVTAPEAGPSTSASGPASPGEQRIYRGNYYRRGSPAASERLFWYARWTKAEGAWVRSTHVHHMLGGRVVLRQSALHASDYSLSQFQSEQRQTGVVAEARVVGAGQVRLQRTSGGKLESVVLEHSHPLVVGPTLYGMLLRHWDELVSGRRLVVDYLSIERLDTYAFEIRRVASDATTTTFELAANSFLLSLLVSPVRVVFLNRGRQVLRYAGPSPVLLESGADHESFDTRIEYADQSAVFH